MRLLPAVLLASVLSSTASGQTYTIATFAGGALPANVPGTSASLGSAPQYIATDQAGNYRLQSGGSDGLVQAIDLVFHGGVGDYNDGYADNLELILSEYTP